MSKTLRRAVAALLLVLPLAGQALEWPQEVVAPEGRIVVYQPQPERFEDNRLVGRAAMSILPTGSEEPIFGTFWFESRVDTDTARRPHATGGRISSGRAWPATAGCAPSAPAPFSAPRYTAGTEPATAGENRARHFVDRGQRQTTSAEGKLIL